MLSSYLLSFSNISGHLFFGKTDAELALWHPMHNAREAQSGPDTQISYKQA